MSVAALGIGAASAGMGVIGQMQQNSEAKGAFNSQNRQADIGLQQQQSSDSVRAQQTQKQMLEAASTAAQSAGESGTAGNSVDALINDYHATEGQYMNNLATQNKWNVAQVGSQKSGFRAQAQSRMVSPTAAYLGAALKVGNDGLNSYSKVFKPDATR
jgi:hypothetical protein